MVGHSLPSVLRGEFARLAAGGRTAPRVSGGKEEEIKYARCDVTTAGITVCLLKVGAVVMALSF